MYTVTLLLIIIKSFSNKILAVIITNHYHSRNGVYYKKTKVDDHLVDVNKMVDIGSGAIREYRKGFYQMKSGILSDLQKLKEHQPLPVSVPCQVVLTYC